MNFLDKTTDQSERDQLSCLATDTYDQSANDNICDAAKPSPKNYQIALLKEKNQHLTLTNRILAFSALAYVAGALISIGHLTLIQKKTSSCIAEVHQQISRDPDNKPPQKKQLEHCLKLLNQSPSLPDVYDTYRSAIQDLINNIVAPAPTKITEDKPNNSLQ